MPIIAECVYIYLVKHAPEAICDHCISAGLQLRLQQSNQVTMALGLTREFGRGAGTCADCGETREVTWAIRKSRSARK